MRCDTSKVILDARSESWKSHDFANLDLRISLDSQVRNSRRIYLIALRKLPLKTIVNQSNVTFYIRFIDSYQRSSHRDDSTPI